MISSHDSNEDTIQSPIKQTLQCPRCSSQMAFGQVCVCGYGAKDSLVLALKKRDRSVFAAYILFSIILALAYVHLQSWGPYALQVPLLKAEHMFGILDAKGYMKLAEACIARGKEKCAKQAYIDMYLRTRDIEAIALLAQLEVKTHEADVALETFDAYYKKGGKDPKVALQYALALESEHNYNASIRYLKLSIQQNPDKLAVSATGELLRILLAQQKYSQARNILDNFWASAENAKGYFNNEDAQIQKVLGPKGHKVASR